MNTTKTDLWLPDGGINGGSLHCMLDDVRAAYAAIIDASERLQSTYPHPRDYQDAGPEVYERAQLSWRAASDRLAAVEDLLARQAEGIQNMIWEREERVRSRRASG